MRQEARAMLVHVDTLARIVIAVVLVVALFHGWG